MADDLSTRLDEARTHFANGAFDAALKALSACPQTDPKVVHNIAMCRAVMKPGNYRSVLSKLELPPIQRVKSLKTGQFTSTVVLAYDGQELAFLNAAWLLLHNGALADARAVLMALANVSSVFTPTVRVRIATLLHLATRRSGVDVSETTGNLLADIDNDKVDPKVQQMMQLAFSDTSGLHSWYASSSKTAIERALYLNNLGVEAFADGKQAVAGVFFARAAQTCGDEGCQFVASSIAYNSAVCALARGAEGNTAICALLKAKSTMCGSVLLWLRLAQALLDRFHSTSRAAEEETFEKEIEERVQAIHSGGVAGFPAIPPYQVRLHKSDSSLLNASAQCLQNALCLLLERNERLVEAARRLAATPSTQHILDSVLCMLAYVELCRANYGVVVTLATEYGIIERDVKQATTPRTQAVMACYHVEALCCANRLSQALRVLQSMNLGHFISNKAPNATVEALMVNVCAAYIMSGQWTKAFQLQQQLVAKIPAPVAQLLSAYLDLARGDTASASESISSLPQRSVQER